jgi:C1A family cysteine protease
LATSYAIIQEQTKSDFAEWVQTYNKEYKGDLQYTYRLAVYAQNALLVEQLNDQSNGGAVFELNQFADMTSTEFAQKYLNGYKPVVSEGEREYLDLPKDNIGAPDIWDWKTPGKVTPVKNQAQCGSCWAFSATENIESVWMIAKGLTSENMNPLSPQQIVDCDGKDGGCNGGDTQTAYEYVIKAGGMDTEATYPYHATDGSCRFSKEEVYATISSFKFASKTKNENEMRDATALVAPLSICVDASTWQLYKSGVMSKSQCSGTRLDHCVQITGYDTSVSTPFWNVRNSWGTAWGEKGYIRLQFGANTCALAEEPTTAVV